MCSHSFKVQGTLYTDRFCWCMRVGKLNCLALSETKAILINIWDLPKLRKQNLSFSILTLFILRVHGKLLCELKRLMQRLVPDTTLCTPIFSIPLLLWGLGYWWARRTSWSKIPWGQPSSQLSIISSNERKPAVCPHRCSCSFHSPTQVWGVPASASCGSFPQCRRNAARLSTGAS